MESNGYSPSKGKLEFISSMTLMNMALHQISFGSCMSDYSYCQSIFRAEVSAWGQISCGF